MYWQAIIYDKMKRVFICFFILILYFSCTDGGSIEIPETEEYEFLYPLYTGDNRRFQKEQIIMYFKSVALGTENGANFSVTIKWASDMNIFVGGNPSAEMLSELNLIKEEINFYATDGFSMNIVNDSLQSNYFLFFGNAQDFTKLFPEQIDNIKNNGYGLFQVKWNQKFEITSGYMFINYERGENQKHVLREELTQSLGFPNDILHRDSIFYFELSTVTSYNKYDKEIIRLMYHPKMISGLDVNGVDGALRQILGLP